MKEQRKRRHENKLQELIQPPATINGTTQAYTISSPQSSSYRMIHYRSILNAQCHTKIRMLTSKPTQNFTTHLLPEQNHRTNTEPNLVRDGRVVNISGNATPLKYLVTLRATLLTRLRARDHSSISHWPKRRSRSKFTSNFKVHTPLGDHLSTVGY